MNQLINSESEYREAKERLVALKLTEPEEGSEEADEIDLLSYLIACYERHVIDES